MSSLVRQRAKEMVPPSLMESSWDGDGFESAVLLVMDFHSFALRPDSDIADLIQKAKTSANIPPQEKKKALDYRRSLILAIVANTPSDSPSVERLLSRGYLNAVKAWLDEILQHPDGNVDMLLHLLSNIANLPVTKSIVKTSGMGKAVGTMDKHSVCSGSPNEGAITVRLDQIKESWKKSVKIRKAKEDTPNPKVAKDETTRVVAKRKIEPATSSPVVTKRTKADEDAKRGTSFSNLMKKVSGPAKRQSSPPAKSNNQQSSSSPNKATQIESKPARNEKKKSSKRVKWADHFGGQISVSKLIDSSEVEISANEGSNEAGVSWSDRKKRDRLLEKELLAKVKRAKLMDDDDEDLFPKPQPIKTTTQWRVPSHIQLPPDVSSPELVSPERQVQDDRIKTTPKAMYSTPQEVPDSPHPLTDVEQAVDMTSHAAVTLATIPFFAPQQPVVADANTIDFTALSSIPGISIEPPPDSAATLQYVQSLGLPEYLTGQPVKTLKTLAESPSLLNTMLDAQGVIDRNQLMNLVHALNAPSSSHAPSASPYQTSGSVYGGVPEINSAPYGLQLVAHQPNGTGGAFRNRSSDEGNLHVIGYGPSTTEKDLIAAFSPYVHVDEVVMKSTFSFVNTSDPVNAMRAKSALTGTLIGGMPIRINNATRKAKDFGVYGSSDAKQSFTGAQTHQSIPTVQPTVFLPQNGATQPPSHPSIVAPVISQSDVSVESVRDDKGNPATKNLFVAGYGQGTTEGELRELFSKYADVTGVISKGNFSFVNTSDRAAAVRARQVLSGTMFNGGVLRINFAKETGRLGTSFDLTYGRNTGPNARRTDTGPQPMTQPVSYYGRGF